MDHWRKELPCWIDSLKPETFSLDRGTASISSIQPELMRHGWMIDSTREDLFVASHAPLIAG